jgi:serine/threonine protein kinase
MKHGGAAIDVGASGCVFRPAIKCKGRPDYKGVSKLMSTEDANDEHREISRFNVVLSTIDNATDYFIISGIEYCGELEALSQDDVQTGLAICPNIVEGYINTKLDKYAALQQPDGGISINKYMNDEPNVEFFINLNENMIKLIQNAIVPMNKLGVYHFDIKPDNILLGDDAKCRLIDWGISILLNCPIDYDKFKTFSETFGNLSFVAFNHPFDILYTHSPLITNLHRIDNLHSNKDMGDYDVAHKLITDSVIINGSGYIRGFGHTGYMEQWEKYIPVHGNYKQTITDITINYLTQQLVNHASECKGKSKSCIFKEIFDDFLSRVDIWGILMTYCDIITKLDENQIALPNADDVRVKIIYMMDRYLFNYPVYYKTKSDREHYTDDVVNTISELNELLKPVKDAQTVTKKALPTKNKVSPVRVASPVKVASPVNMASLSTVDLNSPIISKSMSTFDSSSKARSKSGTRKRCPKGQRRNNKSTKCEQNSVSLSKKRSILTKLVTESESEKSFPKGQRWNIKTKKRKPKKK